VNTQADIKTPIDINLVNRKIEEFNLPNVGKASIREILYLINQIENESPVKFIRMEMGIPGLPSSQIGIDAEFKALRSGVTSKYPQIEGVKELKTEVARFVKLFLDLDVNEVNCLPSTGSTNGSYISFLVTARRDKIRDTTLFIDPGFPVHKLQMNVLGLKHQSLDVYEYRGKKLKDKLESIFKEGKVSSILYSNPNNPTWICFTEEELKIIGELAEKYDVIVLEDLAYFGMDFRKDYSRPGVPPFQPTVAKYTHNYILLISSSKIFSYAGQRIGSIVISPELYKRNFEDLSRFYTSTNFGHALIYGAAYAVSAGVTHTTQYALTALLRAVNNDEYNFVEAVKIYGKRAKAMKSIFTENGFKIVYDKDDGLPIADGFYFTISYPGFSGEDLIKELIYYGISAISLSNTGSNRKEGIRACVSLVADDQLPELEKRIKLFNINHKFNI
jgi:aspartate/methionine/tyrosine aminotransferase